MSKKKKTFILKVLPIIAICIVMLIPSIYACVFLGSMWDPYGNIGDLPVAVVNYDKSVEYNDKTLSIGDDLVDKLKDNDSLKFNFVDSDTAEQGIENGTYYMVITIPKDFSKNATTLMDANPKKMELDYKTNPGKNYIASKMSSTALEKIKTEIEHTVTETYTQTVFDTIGDTADSLYDAVDGAQKLNDGVGKLSDGNDTITTNLKTLADRSVTFANGANTLNTGLVTYTNGVSSVNDGAMRIEEGLRELNLNVPTLSNGVSALAKGGVSLKDGIKTYTDGVATANTGAQTLNKNSSTLNNGVSTLYNGTTTLKSGIKTYTAGVATANTGAQTLSQSSSTLNNGAFSLKIGSSTLSSGTSILKSGLNTMSGELAKSVTDENAEKIKTLSSGLTSLNTGISQLNDSLQNAEASTLESDLTTVGVDITTAGTELKSASDGLASLQKEISTISSSSWFKSLDATTQASVINGLKSSAKEIGVGLSGVQSNLTTAGADLKTAASTAKEVGKSVDNVKTSVKKINDNSELLLPTASKQVTALYSGLSSVKDTLDKKLIPGATALKIGASQLDGGIDTLKTGLSTYTGGVDTLAKGTKQLNDNSKSLNDGAKSLNDGTKSLKTGVTTYTGGVKTLADGTKKLTDNNKTLNKGATDLSKGANKLKDSVPTLSSGIEQLFNGSTTLANGTKQLMDNNDKLVSGSKELASGATKISDGADKLHDGSKTLGKGLTTVDNGVTTLKKALKKGADTAKDTTISSKQKKMFASPVNANETQVSKVANNGSAMAAYMMCAGLWVAGISFCVVTGAENDPKRIRRKKKLWIRKLLELALFAVGAGAVLVTLLINVNGMDPAYVGRTFALAIMTSVAFTAIAYFFNIILGKVGSFALLVLLVLQLGCAGGTYPLDLSPSIYRTMKPFFPFSYAVDGFRMTIATGQDITGIMLVLAGFAAVFIALSIIVTTVKVKSKNEKKYGLSRLLDEAFSVPFKD